MTIPEEVTKFLLLTSSANFWIIIGVFFAVSYLIVGLLTWSFIKPLKYLGIPTICVGTLFVFIRLSSGIALKLFGEKIEIIEIVLPELLKPIFIIGIVCLITGVLMVVSYFIISNIIKKKLNNDINSKQEQSRQIDEPKLQTPTNEN